MQNCFSSRELLLERLEERKYCLQEIISKCLQDKDLKYQFSKSAAQIIERLEDSSKTSDQRPLSTFCIPSESILFIPKELWEESNVEESSVRRKLKVFQVSHLKLSSNHLVVAGESWVSFWSLPSKDNSDVLPHCANLKWLEPHLKVINLVLSQDGRYLLIQACEKVEHTRWATGELTESSSVVLCNLLFSLEDYSLEKSFNLLLPVECLRQKVKQWSVLLSCRQDNILYLYTISNKCALYWMDVMEETLFLRRLSCDGLRFLAINRIESNRTKDEMNECFIYGLSDGGSIEVYQSNKHLLSFKVSELKGMLGLEWIIPFRVYFTKNVHILNICKEHLALAYVFMEWDTSSSCYILHFMIQSDNQTRVKVKNISLGFLGNKKLEKWNLSMEPNPLLWLSTRDGMVILIDMERCQHIGNIVLTKTESDKGLIDFLSFDNRAVAVWKDAPGLIHLWQNLHM